MTFLTPLTAQDCETLRGGALTIAGLGRLRINKKAQYHLKKHKSQTIIECHSTQSSSCSVSVHQSHPGSGCSRTVATITSVSGHR
jgi:hypothetical protein